MLANEGLPHILQAGPALPRDGLPSPVNKALVWYFHLIAHPHVSSLVYLRTLCALPCRAAPRSASDTTGTAHSRHVRAGPPQTPACLAGPPHRRTKRSPPANLLWKPERDHRRLKAGVLRHSDRRGEAPMAHHSDPRHLALWPFLQFQHCHGFGLAHCCVCLWVVLAPALPCVVLRAPSPLCLSRAATCERHCWPEGCKNMGACKKMSSGRKKLFGARKVSCGLGR